MTEHDEADWETEDVELTKPVATVISVRFPKDVAERIFAEAERRGVRTSVIVREAIELFLEDGNRSLATVDLSISSPDDVPVALYTGRSRLERTKSTPSSVQLVGSE